MRKLMKRLFAFAAVMLMMVSLIPTVAFAAETKTDEKRCHKIRKRRRSNGED